MPSIVIPAHNEQALIAACLSSILNEDIPELEIVVAANGCSDDTAAIARTFEPRVRVLDIEAPGKTNALNVAERALRSFPRLFIDGDIVVQPGALRAVLAELERPGILIASPPPEFQLSHASWPVRQFYRALRANPYFGWGAPNGSGIFGVTEEGRNRWHEFPDIISDDGFVQSRFHESERATAIGPGACVRVPAEWRSLLAIQVRSRIGTMQLKQMIRAEGGSRSHYGPRTAFGILAAPRLWVPGLVYVLMRLQERRRARAILASSEPLGWLRDESSRRVSTQTTAGGE